MITALALLVAFAAQAPAPAPTEAEVKALVETWLEAQNDGDLTAYERTYAPRFFGIKRSGPRTRSFDRKGWLADRARMFSRKMKVEASELKIVVAGDAAVVTFTQTWASGRYRDVGPKQLVVARIGGRLAITREEMLASRLTAGAAKAKSLDDALFRFVAHLDTGSYLILRRYGDGDPLPALDGPPKLAGHASPSAALRALAPGSKAAGPEGELVLYGKSGEEVCRASASADARAVVRQFYPHFAMVQDWSGDPRLTDRPKPSDAELAREIWDTGGAGLLVARLLPAAGARCDDAIFAREAVSPPPEVLPTAHPSPELDAAVDKAFRALPAYEALQKEFLAGHRERRGARWDRMEGASPEHVYFSDDEITGYVALRAVAGMGCGEFLGELWAVWRVTTSGGGRPRLRVLTEGARTGESFLPLLAVDLDGDGEPELMDRSSLVRAVGPTFRRTLDVEPPSFDCPC